MFIKRKTRAGNAYALSSACACDVGNLKYFF